MPIVRTARKTVALLAVTASLVAAACSGRNDAGADSTTATPIQSVATTAPAAATTEPEPGRIATTNVATTAARDTVPATTGAPVPDLTVVALDELTALSLVSLGVTPDVVLTTLGSEAYRELASTLGTDSAQFSVAEPSLELLATFDADVFVGLANPNITGRVGDYEAIAPTVLAPLEGSWQDQLRSFAAAFDADDRAEQVIEAVEARVTTVTARVGAQRPEWSISVLTGRLGNTIAINASGAVGTLLSELGVARPEPQQAAGPPGIPFVPVSPESLTSHDADTLLLAVGDVFDTSSITGSPLYSGLSAVTSGSVFDVIGDHWVLGGSAFATWSILDDVELLLDGDAPAQIDDTIEIWGAFLTAVSP